MNEIYEAARQAAARGWAVMPILRGEEKKPAVKWLRHQTEMPTDKELERWFRQFKDCNLGLITGALSRVFIIDADTMEGNEWLLSKDLPPCPIVQGSAEYKRHYYFKHPGFDISNSVKKIHGGVDVRGDGGYAVLPPSIHANGQIYQWIVSPDECPIPDAPDWLLELVRRREFVPVEAPSVPVINLNGSTEAMQKYANAAMEAELSLVTHAPDGEKHAQLFKSVAKVAEFIPHGLLSEGDIKAHFFDVVQGRAKDKKNALETIEDALRRGRTQPRRLPEIITRKQVLIRGRDARAFVRGVRPDEIPLAEEDKEESKDESERVLDSGIYAVLNGRTLLEVQKKSKQTAGGEEETGIRQFVCDWVAEIVGEVTDEDGNTIFDIEGRTYEGRHFTLSAPADNLSNANLMVGKFLGVVGAKPSVVAGMEKHLVPSFRSFSDSKSTKRIRRFQRVGWTKESEKDLRKREFIMPGMLKDDVDVTGLDSHLAYNVIPPTSSELSDESKEAFHCLILSQEPKNTLLAITTVFAAPLSLLCGFQSDKYALFISGRTGSFKTSFCQVLMCLFGDFIDESVLIKFGLGTTANSLQTMLTRASFMPVLIDNFKTNTGKGVQDAVSMIQTALEGGEKIRLTRNADLRPTKPINAWLILTGEDNVEDAASRARTLLLNFAFHGDSNDNLSRVQELAADGVLKQLGGHLLAWALTDEAQIVGDMVKSKFPARRSKWATFIKSANKDAVNAYRVASNFAVCESTWEMILGFPLFASVLALYDAQFQQGLRECARNMAFATAETHEATRYLDALRELISSDRAYLCPRRYDPKPDERRLKLGWYDKGGVYLLPDTAFESVVKARLAQGGLSNMSKSALHRQLADQKHIAIHKKDHYTTQVRTGVEGKKETVLFIKYESFFVEDADNEVLD